MYMGFEYSTRSGTSIGVNDFVIPDEKEGIIARADAEVKEIESQFCFRSGNPGRKVQ